MCEMAGRPEEELLTRTLQDIVHSDELEATVELFEGLRTGEHESVQAENRYVRADGRVVTRRS